MLGMIPNLSIRVFIQYQETASHLGHSNKGREQGSVANATTVPGIGHYHWNVQPR